jgi:crossover junction endodeoxyribonuclease RuvC
MSTQTKNNILILGIDPGYDRCGFALIEKNGQKDLLINSVCFETDRKNEHPQRLLAVGLEFTRWLKKYSPDYIGIESVFFEKNQLKEQ